MVLAEGAVRQHEGDRGAFSTKLRSREHQAALQGYISDLGVPAPVAQRLAAYLCAAERPHTLLQLAQAKHDAAHLFLRDVAGIAAWNVQGAALTVAFAAAAAHRALGAAHTALRKKLEMQAAVPQFSPNVCADLLRSGTGSSAPYLEALQQLSDVVVSVQTVLAAAQGVHTMEELLSAVDSASTATMLGVVDEVNSAVRACVPKRSLKMCKRDLKQRQLL